MRLVQITPGSGDQFYCENCLRDAALVRALRAEGVDVVLVPMYLPLSLDGDELLERTEIFFGGVSVYLQQKFGLAGRFPDWLRRWLDSESLLRHVSKRAGMTSARQLGEMTLSMLNGPSGRQAAELERLGEFLSALPNKPDAIVLSNLLLAGLAPRLKERLKCQVLCWLQDEDGFVDALGAPWTEQVWNRLKQLAEVFDFFLPVSRYYAEVMEQRLEIPREKMFVCPPGLEMSDYKPAPSPPAVPTIGFLGRMSAVNGLDILVEAFLSLASSKGLEQCRLLVCGGKNAADEAELRRLRDKLKRAGLSGRVEFLERFEKSQRLLFLQRLTVLCSPVRFQPAYAMNVLEAMACGVPFAAPRCGVYPEWAQCTGGGLLYEPNEPRVLCEVLEPLLREPQKAAALGSAGRQAVLEQFDIRRTARRLLGRFEGKRVERESLGDIG